MKRVGYCERILNDLPFAQVEEAENGEGASCQS